MISAFKFIIPAFIFLTCTVNPAQENSVQDKPSQDLVEEEAPVRHDTLKINWLKNISPTYRVSSNHYSDFVMDKKGNSYIACFYTENKTDFIYIVKVDKKGKIIWELNKNNQGRATAIAMDKEENMWITGFFAGTLNFGEKAVSSVSSNALFMAKFNTDGECLQIITSEEGAVGFNIHLNGEGNIMLNGTCGRQLTIGGKVIEKSENQTDQFFMALFDKNGECQMMDYFAPTICKIKSDSEGNFYASGSFSEQFDYQGVKGATDSFYDHDAFLMKTDAWGKVLWIKQYGDNGIRREGYRSYECFNDFVIENDGRITAFGLSEKSYSNAGSAFLENDKYLRSVIVTFNGKGEIKNEKPIVKHPSEGAIQTIVKNTHGNYFLTFSAKPNFVFDGNINRFEGDSRSVILKYNENWELIKMELPTNDTDALFREARSFNDRIYYTGHYRNEIAIGEHSIKNGGEHMLFMMEVN